MLRAGLIRQVAAGIFEYLPLGLRAKKKIEAIMRAEMDAIDGQEIVMPVVQPASLWKRSGRWYEIGDDLARLTDRGGRELVLGMTHEEVDHRTGRRRDQQLSAAAIHALPDSNQVPRRTPSPRRPDPRTRVHDEGRLLLPYWIMPASTNTIRSSTRPISTSSGAPGWRLSRSKAIPA